MELPEVTNATWSQEVLDANKPVLIDFWAPGCQPCLELVPTVEALAQAHATDLKVVTVNALAQENWPLCLEQGVMGLPLYLLFRQGQEVQRLAGQVTPSMLRALIAETIQSARAHYLLGDLKRSAP